jgi:hypothetical protein
MVKFKKSFGRLFGLPNRGTLAKTYLQKCKNGQPKFKSNNTPKKKKITKKTGWWFKFNKRTIIKKTKRPQCY